VFALLVGAVRAGRFSEGAFEEFCRAGCVLSWLRRLRQIDDGEEG